MRHGSDSWMKGSLSRDYCLMEGRDRMVGLVVIDFFVWIGKSRALDGMDGMDGVLVYH